MRDYTILLAEDDEGHATLVKRNLSRAGILNPVIHFHDGEAALNFLFKRGQEPHRKDNEPYLLLLDIRMPKIDGVEVLREIKGDKDLRIIPVIMLTTTDDPFEVENCHKLGCSSYVTKPVEYMTFIETIQHLGLFLKIIQVPDVELDL